MGCGGSSLRAGEVGRSYSGFFFFALLWYGQVLSSTVRAKGGRL
jgi:hypothetical protein